MANLQGFSLTYYLNKPNRKGLGKIYARYRIAGKLYRISTNLQGKKDYWDDALGELKLRRDAMSRVDWITYSTIQKELNSLSNLVGEKIEYYICETKTELSPETMGSEIATIINSNFGMGKKKNIPTSLLSLLKGVVLDYDNQKTQSTLMGKVSTFARFMSESGIADDKDNMGMDLMRKWRNWLVDQGYSVNSAKDGINMLFTLATKLERKYGYDFKLDKKKIESIKDKRSTEEKRNNGIALYPEEIEKFKNVDLSHKPKLIPARDMFLIQCWCGCRVEDLPLLLNSKNISKEKDGKYYSKFKTQKKGVDSITPLETLYPALELVLKYKDNCPCTTKTEIRRYIDQIKAIAKMAGLDREITYTGQKGNEKFTEVNKLYEVISSHDGRHTFITNCIREKGLTPDKIRLISGHTDDKMINLVYANLTPDDKTDQLTKAIEETTVKKTMGEAHRETRSREGVESGNKSPIEFCLWLINELGISHDSTKIGVAELMELIAEKKNEIISKYGQKRYEEIKKFIGTGLGETDKKRLELIFCKALNHSFKLVGKIPHKFKL